MWGWGAPRGWQNCDPATSPRLRGDGRSPFPSRSVRFIQKEASLHTFGFARPSHSGVFNVVPVHAATVRSAARYPTGKSRHLPERQPTGLRIGSEREDSGTLGPAGQTDEALHHGLRFCAPAPSNRPKSKKDAVRAAPTPGSGYLAAAGGD